MPWRKVHMVHILKSDDVPVKSCAMAFTPLSIAMENAGVLVREVGVDKEDMEEWGT